MLKIRIHILIACLITGCSRPEGNALIDSYTPPSISSLSDIDDGNAEYNNEPVLIEGLVSPRSQAASVRDRDGFNVHMFNLAAWKEPGGPIIENELQVLRPILQDHDWVADFPSFSSHRLRLLLSTERNRSVLISSEPTDTSSQFQLIAEKLQQPVIIKTDQFGELTLDRRLNWFEGEAQWNGQFVLVSMPANENESSGNALETAKALWADQSSWKRRIEQYAVSELLELKNDTWLQEGEIAFTPDSFIEKMELESIHILPDGKFDFWFDDGDLFWGHAIMVSGDVKSGPDYAGIQG